MTEQIFALGDFEAAASRNAELVAIDPSGFRYDLPLAALQRVIEGIACQCIENEREDKNKNFLDLRQQIFAHVPLQARVTFVDNDGKTKTIVRDKPFEVGERVHIDLSNPGATGFRYENET